MIAECTKQNIIYFGFKRSQGPVKWELLLWDFFVCWCRFVFCGLAGPAVGPATAGRRTHDSLCAAMGPRGGRTVCYSRIATTRCSATRLAVAHSLCAVGRPRGVAGSLWLLRPLPVLCCLSGPCYQVMRYQDVTRAGLDSWSVLL